MTELTLEDFEVRYKNLKESHPDLPKCSVKGCNNPRDITEEMGVDSSCAYHRLLFDYWMSEVMENEDLWHYLKNQRSRRSAFTRWRNKTGKEGCDKIVLEMAQEPINWAC